MRDDGGWRTRGSRYLYRSRWFNLRQDDLTLPNGDDITYTLIEHGGYVVVVPILDDGRVVMERIYRHTVGATLLECPSGSLDGDDPIMAARRELEEETGYRAGSVTQIGSFFGSTGISNERFDVCVAEELSPDGTVERENTEQIEVELVELAVLETSARCGEIADGPSALALLLAAQRRRS